MGLILRNYYGPLFQADPGGGGSALGTGENPDADPTPPAGESNADKGGGSTPETVPYARFKEVNDELAGYKELRQLGYDPNSLGRLVQFESALVQDPADALARLVDNLELPDHVKDGVKAQIAAQDPDPGGAGPREPGTNGAQEDQPPAWAKSLLDREQKESEREQKEAVDAEERGRKETLDAIMNHWREKDKGDGIETPESTMLAYISANIRSGGTVESVADAARADRLEAREADLQGVSREVGNTSGSPRPVPSGGPPAAQGTEFKDIKSATDAARAAIEAGTLPGIGG